MNKINTNEKDRKIIEEVLAKNKIKPKYEGNYLIVSDIMLDRVWDILDDAGIYFKINQ